jgi:glucose-6-phosphate-specific signal transduction histidine kinase
MFKHKCVIASIMIIHYVRKLACNKQLSELILQSVSGGVTLSTIPYLIDEFLAKVHQSPLSAVRDYLVEHLPSP